MTLLEKAGQNISGFIRQAERLNSLSWHRSANQPWGIDFRLYGLMEEEVAVVKGK